MKYPFAAMTVLGLLAGGLTPAHAANSHVESVLAGQSDVSVFYQALLNTGVANELRQDTDYTIFAPTNAAFAEIQPNAYPCFYNVQCRGEVAAILRNHIVPTNESVSQFARWGGDIPTIGKRYLDVREAFVGDYTVDGHRILNKGQGNDVSVYQIDGVIASDQELAQFRMQPLASIPDTVTQKTVTTYRTQGYSSPGYGYPMPGGYPATSTVVYMTPDESPDGDSETTTVTRTTTNR